MASIIAGTPFNLSMTERNRSAFGAKLRFIRLSTVLPGIET